MVNAENGRNYYALTKGGCACEFHRNEPGNGFKLIDLLEDCLEYGELTLFFYWDNGDYRLYVNDVHSYINKKDVKKIKILFEDFLDTFMTKEFNGDNIVYIIEKNEFDNRQ